MIIRCVRFALFCTGLLLSAASLAAKAASVESLVAKTGADGTVSAHFTLSDASGKGIGPDALDTVHEKKMHLMTIDSSLTDYQHLHPSSVDGKGRYQFSWKPRLAGHTYRYWLEVTPSATHQTLKLSGILQQGNIKAPPVFSQPEMHKVVDGLRYRLSFDSAELQPGKMVVGKIRITTLEGKPVRTLEPIMGAYAHLAGFDNNFRDMVHLHPMGDEPTTSDSRGGPELVFHFQPEKPGVVRLFAQVKIDGREHIVPFTLIVEQKKALA